MQSIIHYFLLFLSLSCFIFVVTVHATAQDDGICGFIAGTNIQSITNYNAWGCSNADQANSNPCLAPWPGIVCNAGGLVSSITLTALGITGKYLFKLIPTFLLIMFMFYAYVYDSLL